MGAKARKFSENVDQPEDRALAESKAPPATTADDRSAEAPGGTPPGATSTLQKELARLLEMTWEEKALVAFVQHYKPGLGRNEYLATLCAPSDAYRDLLQLRCALREMFAAPGIKLSLDVSNAIALSALVLYERHHAASLSDSKISAANLLMAAVQASARQGIDVVINGDDAANRAPSNSALLPGGFTAYRKDGGVDPEWEEIKLSLNFSAEVLMDAIGDLSHRAMREKFALRIKTLEERHGAISDGELKTKLQLAKERLGGHFVFFVDHGDTDNPACKHRQRIMDEFGVQTVLWKCEREASDAAGQIDAIFECLFETTQGVGDAPPTDAGSDLLDNASKTLKKTTEIVKLGDKLLDASAKVAEKTVRLAGPLSSIWNTIKSHISWNFP